MHASAAEPSNDRICPKAGARADESYGDLPIAVDQAPGLLGEGSPRSGRNGSAYASGRACTPPREPSARSAFRRGSADDCIPDPGERLRRRPRRAARAHVRRPAPACRLPGLDRATAGVRTIAIAFRPAHSSRSPCRCSAPRGSIWPAWSTWAHCSRSGTQPAPCALASSSRAVARTLPAVRFDQCARARAALGARAVGLSTLAG